MTNAVFLPIIYLVYPETSSRTLEDLDAYFRAEPSLIVTKDKDAISSKRPLKYIEREEEEVQKVGEEDAEVMRRSSKVSAVDDANIHHHEVSKME